MSSLKAISRLILHSLYWQTILSKPNNKIHLTRHHYLFSFANATLAGR